MKVQSLVLLLGIAAVSAEPKVIPADAKAMLDEHVGSWRTTGWSITDGKKEPVEATWECRVPGKGPGVFCTWHHAWADGRRDTEYELVGYDFESGKLRFSRLREDGSLSSVLVGVHGKVMSSHWEFTRDGKKGVGDNHIEVRESGVWEQHLAVEVDGKPTFEMSVTQKRIGAAPAGSADDRTSN